MKIRIEMAVAVIAVLMTLTGMGAFAAPEDEIARIGLTAFSGARQVTVSSVGTVSISRTLGANAEAKSVIIDATAKGLSITVDGRAMDAGELVALSPLETDSVLTLEASGRPKRAYRGNIEVAFNKGTLSVVNVVRVEDYLLGVLPAEMPELFPEESLKAQAIAARTYYYANKNKHMALGYNLCDSTDCQSYSGTLLEKPRCSKAVKDTCGQVLTFAGQPASVFYSADCGGVTRNYSETRPHFDAPYLVSVVEPEDIQHSSWQKDYKLVDLEKALITAGIKEAVGLKSVAVARVDSAGWALDVTVTGSSSISISASRLRTILGVNVIKSTFFSIEAGAGGLVSIKGKGCGHGWGMCQVGAKALAQPPHNRTHGEILAHYFPGTMIEGRSAPTEAVADVAMVAGDGTGPTPLPAPRDEANSGRGNAREARESKKAGTPLNLMLPKKPEKRDAPVIFDVRLQVP